MSGRCLIRPGRHLVWAIALLATLGCTLIDKEIGDRFIPAARAMFAAGDDLHVDRVLSTLGPPQSVSALPGGYAFVYQQIAVRERQFGITPETAPLNWFKLALADADARIKSLVIVFDNADWVASWGIGNTVEDAGDSSALMLAITVKSLVDTQELSGGSTYGVARWGMSLLHPADIQLNRGSSVDSGENGAELRGSPRSVGQRTLEHR